MKEFKSPTIPASRIAKIYEKTKVMEPDAPITLEFLLMATFPTVWENIQKYANDCYTQGYIQGLNEGKQNEDKRNN